MFIIKTKDKNRKKVKLEHGNGSIYFVESRNRYAGQVTLLINNKKVRKTAYGKTDREVKNKLRELQIQALAGNLDTEDKEKAITVYELAEKLIDEQLALNEIRQSSYDRK